MLLNTTILAILSGLFGLGILIIFAAFAIPRVMSNRFIEDPDGSKRIGSVAEAQVLSAMVSDLGRSIGREKGDLDELLRKSGYIYQSPQEYYARRIYTSLITAVLGGVLGYFLDLGFVINASLATGGLLYGFSMPSRAVQNAIKKRRERIQDEMGFGLEQIVNLLNTGTSLSDSLSQ
ncbi:MAG: hypothetical protein KAH12_11750, partial [Anaerolineales bacterium]|nr:hypothetical protein [Anaerolineales bacterium]